MIFAQLITLCCFYGGRQGLLIGIALNKQRYRGKVSCSEYRHGSNTGTVSDNCMKTIAHILIVIGLLGCGQGERKLNDQTDSQDSTLNKTEIVRHSMLPTELKIYNQEKFIVNQQKQGLNKL